MDNYSKMRKIIWTKQPSIEIIFILAMVAFTDMTFPFEELKD